MSGRDKYSKFQPIINLVSIFFKFMPLAIRKFFWELSSPFSGYISLTIRYAILSSSTEKCGRNIYTGSHVVIKNMKNITLGENISFHDGCYIDGAGGIEIGNNVSIAHHSSLISFNHTWTDISQPIKYNPVEYAKVVIEEDVWIGCAVRIMPGVTISKRSVIAAGSVVVKNVSSNSLVAGVPAKKIKDLTI